MGNDINPISTVVDVVADNRTYYDCPRCGKRKWAYGAFAGNVCLDCPGTVLSAVGNTTNMVSCGSATTTAVVLNHISSEITQTTQAILRGSVNIIAEDHNAGNGTKAEYCGDVIFYIQPQNKDDYLSDAYKNQTISYITTKSCGIKYPIANGSGIDHWWMNINTSSGYYQIQFLEDGSKIELRKCASTSECDETGLAEGSRDENITPNKESSYSKSVSSGKTLGDLVSWLKSGRFSCRYNLYNNNCQDLCKEIYRWI